MGNLTTMFGVNDGPRSEANGWRFCFNRLAEGSPANFNWWNPSRIIMDYRVTGMSEAGSVTAWEPETINEFPAFSFLLADMHPHVLVLPWRCWL